jgi:predicted transcriptional regulator
MLPTKMRNSTTAAETLRRSRSSLGVSQSKLARMSGVSRFKICTYEMGDSSLSADERDRIQVALQAEVDRLRNLPGKIEFGRLQSAAPDVELG